MPKGSQCDRCNASIDRKNGSVRSRSYIVCAMHPNGPDSDPCPDYQADSFTQAVQWHRAYAAVPFADELRRLADEQLRITQIAYALGESEETVTQAILASNYTAHEAYQLVMACELTIRDGRFVLSAHGDLLAAQRQLNDELKSALERAIDLVLRAIFSATD